MISRLNLKISIKNCGTFFFKHLLTKDKMCFWRRSSSVSHFRVFIEKSLSFECITILAALLCSLLRPSLSCLLHPAHTVSQYSNTGRICAWYMELAAWLVRCLRSRPSMPTFFPALDVAYLVCAFHDSVSSRTAPRYLNSETRSSWWRPIEIRNSENWWGDLKIQL